MRKIEWEHVVYLDGKELPEYRSNTAIKQETIKEICSKYNAVFKDDSDNPFPLKHKPEFVYRFRTREIKK